MDSGSRVRQVQRTKGLAVTADAEQAKKCALCERPVLSRGLCNAHYKAERKSGRLPTVIRPKGLTLPEAFAWYQSTPMPSVGCWDWQGGQLDRDGYGEFSYGSGSAMRAHRASYLIHVGEIPDGLLVRHTCDRRICVMPSHLIVGTNDDNMRDMVERERARRGEGHHNSKMSEDSVREVRALFAAGGTKKGLGRQFGVSDHTIHQIVTGVTWSHVS